MRVQDEGVKTAWVGLWLTGGTPIPAQTPVTVEGRAVGRITYSDHGYSVGAALATAHVERDFATEGPSVSVLGKPARVARRAFFDAEGLRLKS